MEFKTLPLWLFVLLAALLAVFMTGPARAVTAVPNKTLAVLKVLEVRRTDFPQVQVVAEALTSVDQEGYKNLVKVGQSLAFEPLYIRDEKGALVLNDQTVQNLAAYYLLPGDLLTAQIWYVGDERDGRWWATGLQRVPR